MPFTFSHPAFILPFFRIPEKYVSVTALVIGSMAPDFEYFFTMNTDSAISHSIAGVFIFNLPLVFLLAIVFHLLIKKTLLICLPIIVSNRLAIYKHLNVLAYIKDHFFVFIISALFGICSHLFLDAFTHKQGYFVELFSVFRYKFVLINHEFELYRFLQHGFSFLGLFIVFYAFLKLPKTDYNNSISKMQKIFYWLTIVFISTAILFARFLMGSYSIRYGYWAVNAISAFMSALVLTSTFYRLKKYQEIMNNQLLKANT